MKYIILLFSLLVTASSFAVGGYSIKINSAKDDLVCNIGFLFIKAEVVTVESWDVENCPPCTIKISELKTRGFSPKSFAETILQQGGFLICEEKTTSGEFEFDIRLSGFY